LIKDPIDVIWATVELNNPAGRPNGVRPFSMTLRFNVLVPSGELSWLSLGTSKMTPLFWTLLTERGCCSSRNMPGDK
jgi:hypothetical protein